jgi:hypothetical protein
MASQGLEIQKPGRYQIPQCDETKSSQKKTRLEHGENQGLERGQKPKA